MKKLFLIFVLSFLSLTVVGQDTSEMCIPYSVAQKMLLELTDYDMLKELSKLDKDDDTEDAKNYISDFSKSFKKIN
jgi:hypothetical protein